MPPGKAHCFPKDARVVAQVPNGNKEVVKTIRIDQIQIGMMVQDREGSFSPVVGFLHQCTNTLPIDYIVIKTTSPTGMKTLEISPKHRLFLANGSDIFADDISVGDILAQGEIVQEISTIIRDSLFAPVTASGVIVVNGIVASCYANVPHFIGHMAVQEKTKQF